MEFLHHFLIGLAQMWRLQNFGMAFPSHDIPAHLLTATGFEAYYERTIRLIFHLLRRMKMLVTCGISDFWRKSPRYIIRFFLKHAEGLFCELLQLEGRVFAVRHIHK